MGCEINFYVWGNSRMYVGSEGTSLTVIISQVAAGGALFHLVVDTDEQASNLLRRLKDAKEQGRVTCLPLNKLQVESVQYPDRFGTDALPLTKYLTYSADVKKAIEQASLPTYTWKHLCLASSWFQQHCAQGKSTESFPCSTHLQCRCLAGG